MNNRHTTKYIIICFFSLYFCFISQLKIEAQENQSKSDFQSGSSITQFNKTDLDTLAGVQKIAPGIFEFKGIHIDKSRNQIDFPAVLNMDKGLLEYLIVGEAGKLHESLLRITVNPFDLQIALLFLGLKGGKQSFIEQGYTNKPEGDPVVIWILWNNNGKEEKNRIEEWVQYGEKGKPLQYTDWIFTGSFIYNGQFMAQLEQSIVAVYRDPAAMFDNPLPDGTSDEVWFVNEKAVPPIGTEVIVIIEKIE